FYAGDSGVKLIAARNAVANPGRPLQISLPSIEGAALPYVDPFFAVHGDHSHAVTSELFPLLTAPLLRLFGLRGLYVLPAIGLILAVFGCAAMGAALDPGRSVLATAVVAALATPWFFYGLEFWEHTLALGAAVTAAACF